MKRAIQLLKMNFCVIAVGIILLSTVNQIVFFHLHKLSDGRIVHHSHPYKSQDGKTSGHHHSDYQLVVIGQLNLLFFAGLLVIPMIACVQHFVLYIRRNENPISNISGLFLGRAPPVQIV